MKVAIAILVQNEEEQIPRILKMIEGTDADDIVFFDDYSTDKTVAKIPIGGKISVFSNIWPKTEQSFSVKKNIIHVNIQTYRKSDWVLHIDADEIFDSFFLKNIKIVIEKLPKTISIIFKRINQPIGSNYPDYQTRLLRITPDIVWRGEYHEKPFSTTENRSLLDIALDYKGNVNKEGITYGVLLNEFTIIHLPRRTDIKRSWW